MELGPTTDADHQLYEQHTGYRTTSDFKGIKAVDDKTGETIAVVGYDYWTPNAVQMHIWIKDMKALNGRVLMREAFAYPFEQAGRGVVIGTTPADNEACLAFTKWIGFVELYRIKDGWSVGVDMVIQELRKENCYWLKPCRI